MSNHDGMSVEGDDGSLSLSEQLNHAEQRIKESIFSKAMASRPKSTKNAFDRKQDEFVQWSVSKGYSPPELVTENKVALFLEEQVLYRQNHKSHDGNKKIGKSTINQYISALISLWKYQVANNVNNHPTPRGVLVKSIQKRVDAETFKVHKEKYFDRGWLYQHLMLSEVKKNHLLMSEYFWSYGGVSTMNAFKGLCNRLAYLLSEQGLVRGKNIRDLELPDFFSVEYDDIARAEFL